MNLPKDYLERVYAGVLGKIIGVYAGRPVENWSYDAIQKAFGDLTYYIHEKRDRRLIVTDDDISGTFTFLRALEDFGFPQSPQPYMVGETWRNYLIEKKTTLWWGGLGNSTEHTAYLRLKAGIPAPESGSREQNGKVVSEQIGGQIFIDGWGLVCPNDPEQAAAFARMAASVSHDGEGIYGAQVVAVMVALAFGETAIGDVVDRALVHVPPDCEIRRVADFVRENYARGWDWRRARAALDHEFGYAHYGGVCPIVPNHGLVLLSLLHSGGDFDEGMRIVNTSGWDTDCNAGNVGCVLGVLGGLAAFTKQPWREPVADRCFIPAAEPGDCITDAVRETYRVVNTARSQRGLPCLVPKDGARFHFSLPGSTQGFVTPTPTAKVGNSEGRLEVRFRRRAEVATWTFIPPSHIDFVSGYQLIGSPTIYSGQTLWARVGACSRNTEPIEATLFLSHYRENDTLERMHGPSLVLTPGEERTVEWPVPDCDGYPIAEVGFEVSAVPDEDLTLLVDWLGWTGTPHLTLRPRRGRMWGRAWAPCLDRFQHERDGYGHLVQDEGIGLLVQGTREWQDYRLTARATPHLAKRFGIAVGVQGLRRYYAFVLDREGKACLIKQRYGELTLAEAAYPFELYRAYDLALDFAPGRLRAWIDGSLLFELEDADAPFLSGAIGLFIEEGAMGVEDDVSVAPLVGDAWEPEGLRVGAGWRRE